VYAKNRCKSRYDCPVFTSNFAHWEYQIGGREVDKRMALSVQEGNIKVFLDSKNMVLVGF